MISIIAQILLAVTLVGTVALAVWKNGAIVRQHRFDAWPVVSIALAEAALIGAAVWGR